MRTKGFCFWEEYVTDLEEDEPMGLCRHPEVNGSCPYSGDWLTFHFREDKCPYFIDQGITSGETIESY